MWPYAYNTLQLAEAGIAANSFSVRPTEEMVEEGQGEGGIALRDAVWPMEETVEEGQGQGRIALRDALRCEEDQDWKDPTTP